MGKVDRFARIVIWGLKGVYNSFTYIWNAYYNAFRRCNGGEDTYWVADVAGNAAVIVPNTLIMVWEGACRNLPIRDDCFYITHGEVPEFKDIKHRLCLMSYQTMRYPQEGLIKLEEACYFYKPWNMLYQPWGTNLEPLEFQEPIFNNKSEVVNWVGSVWSDSADPLGGNAKAIVSLVFALTKHKLKFIQKTGTSFEDNTKFVRESRIAPAVAGERHVLENYLPCRFFKNVSYGQLGFSNIDHFQVVYKDCVVVDSNIEKLVDKVMNIKETEYIELVKAQQEITKKYTYKASIKRILNCIDMIER